MSDELAKFEMSNWKVGISLYCHLSLFEAYRKDDSCGPWKGTCPFQLSTTTLCTKIQQLSHMVSQVEFKLNLFVPYKSLHCINTLIYG